MKTRHVIYSLLFGYWLPLNALANAATAPNGVAAGAVWEGTMTLGGEHYFALAPVDAAGRVKKSEWLRVGEKLGDLTIIRFEHKAGALFVKDSADRVHTLRLPEGRTKRKDLPPLPRELALAELDRIIKGLVEQLRAMNVSLALDFEPEKHLSPEQLAQLTKQRAQTELQRGKVFLAAWSKELGLSMFAYPQPGTAFPKYLTANLSNEEVETFAMKWMIATAELSAARTYLSDTNGRNGLNED